MHTTHLFLPRKITTALLLAAATIFAPSLATPTHAFATTQSSAATPDLSSADFIQAKQFHLVNARLPGRQSARQNVTAWQVAQGSWSGQRLDGLTLVFVQSTSDDSHAARLTNCYVSSQATLAQRQALLTAFLATEPQAVPAQDAGNVRLEPAIITLEIQDTIVVLHLGLIA